MLAQAVSTLFHDVLVLFAMVNAVGNLPLFAELTRGMSTPERAACFRKGVLVACSIVVGFALLGNWMLQSLFRVEPSAFQVAGGILVFAVAARGMLWGARQSMRTPEESFEDVAVFPMGFPFLAGPGTIVTTILLLQTDGHLAATLAALIVYAAVLPTLHLAPLLERAVGKVSILVVTRILYIFIAAKAVSFVVTGMRALLMSPAA